MRTIYIIILLAFGLPMPRLAAQVSVEAKLDSADILIGEQVHLTATVNVDKGRKVAFPDFEMGYLTQGVEVLERGKVDTVSLNEGKRWSLSRSYTLTSFDSALYYLPPVEVVVDGKKFSSPDRLGLKVGTVPVDTVHTENIRPAHSVVAGAFVWKPYLLSLSLSLWGILAVIFVLTCKLSDRKPMTRRVVVHPPQPPHKRAMEAIRQIKEQGAAADEKEYYVQLTDILRTYIQERFHFNAREMVSSEIIERLQEVKDASLLLELKEVFQTADLVKFAKHKTSLLENDRNMGNVVEFVDTTKIEETGTPKPIVKEVVVGELKQRRLRITMFAAISVLGIAGCFVGWHLFSETLATFL